MQHVKFTSQMSAWAYYVAFVKKNIWILDEIRVQAKRSTELQLPTGLTPTSVKRNKDVSKENVTCVTGRKNTGNSRIDSQGDSSSSQFMS